MVIGGEVEPPTAKHSIELVAIRPTASQHLARFDHQHNALRLQLLKEVIQSLQPCACQKNGSMHPITIQCSVHWCKVGFSGAHYITVHIAVHRPGDFIEHALYTSSVPSLCSVERLLLMFPLLTSASHRRLKMCKIKPDKAVVIHGPRILG